jgi:hypothetical protein
MARSYRRDSNGRFSSGGGSSAKASGGARAAAGLKAAATRSANTARAAALKAKGTTMLGKRIKPKGFTGGKAAQKRAGGLMLPNNPRRNLPKGKRSTWRSAPAASKPAAKKPAKMSKAPVTKAKAAYKAATSKVRELKMYRGGRTDAVVKAAQARVARMEKNRGVSRKRKR